MTNDVIPTIIVCEKNTFLAESLCDAFCASGAFNSLAIAECDETLMALVEETRANAVLINPAIVEGRPADLAMALAEAHGICRPVAYFDADAALRAAECLREGFTGAVSQHASIEDLEDALRTVCLGGMYVDQAIVDNTIGNSGARPAHLTRGLSEREQFVLEHVARGLSHKEIARLLDLSSKTVETYKLRGSRKLGLSRKSSIVDYALRNNWLS